MSKQPTPALEEAFLDMPAMIAIVRQHFDKIEEPRSRKRPTHSLTDCLVSCLAMFHFRDRSMLQFELASKLDSRQRNLRLMYQLNGDAPSDTTMRRRLNKVDPDGLRPAFSAIWQAVEEHGMLKPFEVFGGRVAVADANYKTKSVHGNSDRLCPFQNAVSAMAALDVARAEAERMHGPLTRMPTLVTDNGSCFTAHKFQKHIEELFEHVRIQYRTPQQLGLLERFHGTLKKEEVHWRTHRSPDHARQCLAEFRERYNRIRPHWALRPHDNEDPLTPADVYEYGCVVVIPKWQGWARAAAKKLKEAGFEPADELEAA